MNEIVKFGSLLAGKVASKIPEAINVLGNTIKKWPWDDIERVKITISAIDSNDVLHQATATIFKNLSAHYKDM